MKILVLNCGSSSVKFQLIKIDGKVENSHCLFKGVLEKIGHVASSISCSFSDGTKKNYTEEILDHKHGIQRILDEVAASGIISGFSDIHAVGHRVTHGGEYFSRSVIIDDRVEKKIEELCELAPLHNPHNLKGNRASKAILPGIHHVAVFDTAFHSKLPPHAYMYGLPFSMYQKYKIRRYGFHGTSHRFVSARCAALLDKPFESLKIISCHLGNGSSIAAIRDGHSVDTSMGFTPLEGLMMGTRCGDIDPAIPLYLLHAEELTTAQLGAMLNKHSGLYGISGISGDIRDIIDAARKGSKKAGIAIDMLCYRIKKYIGSYLAVLDGADVIIFTAGIGENVPLVREKSLGDMEFCGIKIDRERNESSEKEKIISTDSSKVKVYVIPTNEELMIACDTVRIIEEMRQ